MTPSSLQRPEQRDIVATWWPLAASWLFMGFELPIVSAALARLAAPELQLAAFGGIVYPMMLLIESPVIMLLAASTALSRDWHTFLQLRGYMNRMSATLTVLHVVIVVTPLWDVVVRGMLGAPDAIVAPARIGLLVAVPWTWSIAYRRFLQGILIRNGASRAIGAGTLLRLSSAAAVLLLGLWLDRAGYDLGIPGVAIGTAGVITGVLAEVFFIHARARPVVAAAFDPEAPPSEDLGLRRFLAFYVPLALTSLLSLAVQPIGAAAVSRMPLPIQSLAAWPVVIGLIFVLRAGGTSYKEVVVAILDRPDPLPALRRFTVALALGTLALTAVFVFTPVADLWLRVASGLPADLASLARNALLIGVAIPFLGVLQNWYVGILVYTRQTRAITESMVGFLAACTAVLVAGVFWQELPGLYVALRGLRGRQPRAARLGVEVGPRLAARSGRGLAQIVAPGSKRVFAFAPRGSGGLPLATSSV